MENGSAITAKKHTNNTGGIEKKTITINDIQGIRTQRIRGVKKGGLRAGMLEEACLFEPLDHFPFIVLLIFGHFQLLFLDGGEFWLRYQACLHQALE